MQRDILLITGGSSGLGLEIVKEALCRGLFVCSISQNPDKVKAMNETFPESFLGFAGDINDGSFLDSCISKILEHGNITYLINNAARAVFKDPAEYSQEDIATTLSALSGMVLCTSKVLKVCGEKDLTIINILSSAALKGKPKETLYCAAKWGERGYTEALKAAYAKTSVKVIAVYPSGINTEFWDTSRDYISEAKSDTFMDPKTVASVILDNLLNYQGLSVSDLVIER